jgi:hypothetical protein
MDLVLKTSVVSVGDVCRRLAAIGEQLAARARAIVMAVGDAVPSSDETSSIQAVERQRDRQKAFGAFHLGGKGFFS